MSGKSWNPSHNSSFSDFLLRLETQDFRLDGLLHALTLHHRAELPDFGPIGPEYSPFISSLLIGKPQKCGQIQKLAYPSNLSRLSLKLRRFDGDFCNLHDEMKSSPDSVFYFVHRFASGKKTRFAVLLGYDGPVKVWINGKNVFTDPVGANPAFRDKEEIPFTAKAGGNEIMVALQADGGKAWGIYLRLKYLKATRNDRL